MSKEMKVDCFAYVANKKFADSCSALKPDKPPQIKTKYGVIGSGTAGARDCATCSFYRTKSENKKLISKFPHMMEGKYA